MLAVERDQVEDAVAGEVGGDGADRLQPADDAWCPLQPEVDVEQARGRPGSATWPVKEWSGSLNRTLTSPETWSLTTMSSRPSPSRSAKLSVGRAGTDRAGEGGRAEKVPSAAWKAMVTVWSRSLATTRSPRPSPLRSALAMRTGCAPVATEPTRRKRLAAGDQA